MAAKKKQKQRFRFGDVREADGYRFLSYCNGDERWASPVAFERQKERVRINQGKWYQANKVRVCAERRAKYALKKNTQGITKNETTV